LIDEFHDAAWSPPRERNHAAVDPPPANDPTGSYDRPDGPINVGGADAEADAEADADADADGGGDDGDEPDDFP